MVLVLVDASSPSRDFYAYILWLSRFTVLVIQRNPAFSLPNLFPQQQLMKPITPAQNKRTLAYNRVIPTPTTTRVTRATSKTNAVKEVEPVSPAKKLTRRTPPNPNDTDKQQVKIARSKSIEDETTEKQPIKVREASCVIVEANVLFISGFLTNSTT